MATDCFNRAKKRFIEKCNIEEITVKRKYLKLIIEYYYRKNIQLIPKQCVCKDKDECSELLNDEYLSQAILSAKRSQKGPTAAKKVENYIQYPIFMGLLRIEIKKDKKWIKLITEESNGLKPEISYDDPYFDNNNDDHIRYPYIVMVMLLIHKMKSGNYSERQIIDHLNNNGIVIFSAKNRSQTDWDGKELLQQEQNSRRINQLNKADDLQNFSINTLTARIQNMYYRG